MVGLDLRNATSHERLLTTPHLVGWLVALEISMIDKRRTPVSCQFEGSFELCQPCEL